ncbi:MAG: spore maturation protein [Clostridia bacterium]|nr:spore maturation protein [Clostridia bacterium]
MQYVIPILFAFIFIFAIIKKIPLYDSFVEGAKGAIPFALGIFPYLACIFILNYLFEESGISAFLVKLLSPVFSFLQIPKELCSLVLIKPFSGSGALGTLSEIYTTYGVDSYLSRCASVIYGSSETVFYISSVYFVNAKKRNLTKPIIISLFASFCSCCFACLICKIM